jgi:hypothetical protein
MDGYFLWIPPPRAQDSRTHRKSGKVSCRAHGVSAVTVCFLLVGVLSAGCSSLPPPVAALVTGETPADPTYAGRQHFPVSPEEALGFLRDVAPQQGWAVVSTGAEYDTYGQRGTFFRLATTGSGESQTVSGVFYAEPSGSYVRISEQNGLPEMLIEPLITEIRHQKGYR